MNTTHFAVMWHNPIRKLDKYSSLRSTPETMNDLFQMADLQHGLFTAKQAKSAGYSEQAQHHHAKTGNRIREYRGIYRLSRYPNSEWANLMLWQLWSRNRSDDVKGVFSHETARALYEISDVMPAKLHMTVPHGFDRSAAIPPVLVLHRNNVASGEIGIKEGIRLTRPLRTIIDVIAEGTLSPDLIDQAVTQAVSRGLYTADDLRSAATPSIFELSRGM